MKIYKSTFFLFLAIAGCHQHPASMMAVATAAVEEDGGAVAKREPQTSTRTRTRRTMEEDNLDAAAQFDDNDANSYHPNTTSDQRQQEKDFLSSESSYGDDNDPSFYDSQQGTRNLNTDQVFQFSASAHACLLAYDIVQCVGYNYYGQLGQSSSDAFGTPVLLNFPTTITAKPKKVVTGYDHTCTLFDDGRVWCNGSNGFQQLGNGGTANSATPVKVKKGTNVLANVIDIEAGAYHNCAIQATGAMYCWGFDVDGQLGMNDIMDGTTDVKKAVKMALALSSTCVVTVSDTTSVTCTGYGYSDVNNHSISLGNVINKITAGSHHFCALLVGDTAKCWGANNAGQLGIGSTDLNPRYNSAEDVRASPGTSILSSIADINAGHLSTCLVLVNGTPMCFGNNRFYQLGIANGGANVLYPTNMSIAPVSGKTLVSLHVGESTGHAVFNDDAIHSIGTNNGGTFGDGSTVSSRNVVGDVSGAIAPQMGYEPSSFPSRLPSNLPSSQPSNIPSLSPSSSPSCEYAEFATNVALDGTATESSTAYARPASSAIDGNTASNFDSGSVTHTNEETDPWWKVQLSQEYSISQVIVYNRNESFGDTVAIKARLNAFRMTILLNGVEVFRYDDNASLANVVTSIVVPSNVIGDAVKIELFGDNRVLSLAEVEVEGRACV